MRHQGAGAGAGRHPATHGVGGAAPGHARRGRGRGEARCSDGSRRRTPTVEGIRSRFTLADEKRGRAFFEPSNNNATGPVSKENGPQPLLFCATTPAGGRRIVACLLTASQPPPAASRPPSQSLAPAPHTLHPPHNPPPTFPPDSAPPPPLPPPPLRTPGPMGVHDILPADPRARADDGASARLDAYASSAAAASAAAAGGDGGSTAVAGAPAGTRAPAASPPVPSPPAAGGPDAAAGGSGHTLGAAAANQSSGSGRPEKRPRRWRHRRQRVAQTRLPATGGQRGGRESGVVKGKGMSSANQPGDGGGGGAGGGGHSGSTCNSGNGGPAADGGEGGVPPGAGEKAEAGGGGGAGAGKPAKATGGGGGRATKPAKAQPPQPLARDDHQLDDAGDTRWVSPDAPRSPHPKEMAAPHKNSTPSYLTGPMRVSGSSAASAAPSAVSRTLM